MKPKRQNPLLPLAVAALAVLAGCARDSGPLRAQTDALVRSLDATRPVPGPLSFAELLERALQLSPVAIESAITAITQQANIDAVAAAGDPTLSLTAAYGESIVQRDDGFHLRQHFSWNLLGYYQTLRIHALAVPLEQARALRTQLTRKQVELAVAKLYFDQQLRARRAALLHEQVALRRRRLALREIEAGLLPEAGRELPAARVELERLLAEEQRALALAALARQRLLAFCRLTPEQEVADGEFAVPELAALAPFEEYLRAAVAHSEEIVIAGTRVDLARELEKVERLSRWTRLRIGIDLGSGSGSPLTALSAPVEWMVNVLDQGQFNREVIRAQLETLGAQLELDRSVRDVTQRAGEAWLKLIEARAALKHQQEQARQVQLEAWAREALPADAARAELALRLRERALAQLEAEYAVILGTLEYEQLRGGPWRPAARGTS